MLFIKDQYVTVWKAEDKGAYTSVQMSSSRKDKKTEEYANSSWSFCRFVGKAHEKAASLVEKDGYTRINIKLGGISREPYMKDGEKLWPKNPSIVIFDFEEATPGAKKSNPSQTPDENDEVPF